MEKKTTRKKAVRKTETAGKATTTKRQANKGQKTATSKEITKAPEEAIKILGVSVTAADTLSNLTGYGPEWLLNTITQYITQETKTIIDIIGPEGYNQLLNMAKSNVKCGTLWQQAKHIKALKLAQKGQLLFETAFVDLPAELFNCTTYKDENGSLQTHKTLTAAGVSYLKAKAEQYAQAARRTESGRIGESDHDPAAVVIHNNISLNLRDIMQRDISELSDITTM